MMYHWDIATSRVIVVVVSKSHSVFFIHRFIQCQCGGWCAMPRHRNNESFLGIFCV